MKEAEKLESIESQGVENLEQLSVLGKERAFALLRERFEENKNSEENLAYHNTKHTAEVIRRAETVANAMGLSQEDVDLAGLAAAFHDTVQTYEKNNTADGKVMRKRFVGKNEQASADELTSFLQEQGNGLVSEDQIKTLQEAIMATVPAFDVENKTVVQPNLKEESNPIVRSVALADIGTGGMEGEKFAEEGDPLFREENLDIAQAIANAETQNSVSTEKQQFYKARMLTWIRSQAGFVRGRQALLERELGNLDDTARENVKALFADSNFKAAIQAVEKLVTDRENKDFWEIARDMGYEIPSE